MSSKEKGFTFKHLKQVFQYVKPYKQKFYFSILLALVLAVLSPLRGLFIQYTVDGGIKGNLQILPTYIKQFFNWCNTHVFNASDNKLINFIVLLTAIQIVLLLIETAIRFLFSYITAWMGQHVVKDLRTKVYSHILKLPLKTFDTTPIGTLTTRTINDIESINEIFADGLIPIISDLLVIIFTLGTMFYIDSSLTLISILPFPILIIATYFFKESVKKSFTAVRNAVSNLNAFVQEHITGMQLVQAFTAEERESQKFRNINQEHRNANIKAIFAYSVFFPVVEVVLAFSIGLLVWWAASHNLDAGKLIAFILFLNQIFRPLRVIADKFNVLQMGLVASERVFKVLEMPASDAAEQHIVFNTPITLNGKIEFDKVWFAYNDENWILKGVSFSIEPGQTLAIVDSTGSGKTTIISLLNALYPFQKGQILIDDKSLTSYQAQLLRSKTGVVLQDVFLFSGSIYDNITLYNQSIKKEQVIEAAKLIGMHDFIMQLPNNYDYNVMERGATLSVGQRQLLSFVRCLLYNPAILILDEATSSIDTESEILIQKAIDKLIAGRTSIIIAHRLSTIRKANKILVLDKGQVIESGTHEELLKMNGLYAKMNKMQFH